MKNNRDTAKTPQALFAELQNLVAEAETMVADSVSRHSNDAVDGLRARFNAAHDRISETCEGAKEKVIAGAKRADAAVRENPYQSLAVALGAGLLLGILVGRRSR